MDNYEAILLGIKVFFSLVLFFSLIFVVLIPMGKSLKSKEDFPDISLKGDQKQWVEEEKEREIQVPSLDDLDKVKPSNKRIIQLAKEQPMETTLQIRKWMQDKNKEKK